MQRDATEWPVMARSTGAELHPHDQRRLEEILNTADADIRRYYGEIFLEEIHRAEERAIGRAVRKYRHRLPVTQQELYDRAMHDKCEASGVLPNMQLSGRQSKRQ